MASIGDMFISSCCGVAWASVAAIAMGIRQKLPNNEFDTMIPVIKSLRTIVSRL